MLFCPRVAALLCQKKEKKANLSFDLTTCWKVVLFSSPCCCFSVLKTKLGVWKGWPVGKVIPSNLFGPYLHNCFGQWHGLVLPPGWDPPSLPGAWPETPVNQSRTWPGSVPSSHTSAGTCCFYWVNFERGQSLCPACVGCWGQQHAGRGGEPALGGMIMGCVSGLLAVAQSTDGLIWKLASCGFSENNFLTVLIKADAVFEPKSWTAPEMAAWIVSSVRQQLYWALWIEGASPPALWPSLLLFKAFGITAP